MPDEPKTGKKPVAIVVVVLLLCALLGGWLVVKSRHGKASNLPPIAALRLDSIDQTNRVILLSDNGSRDQDPDGTLRSWRITWGDGKEDNLSAIPQKAAHTYAAEGEYTISLWCVDDLGATSSVPAMTNINFDFLKRQKALELSQAEAQREADRLKAEAAREAERVQREQEMQRQLAAQQAQKAREQQEMEAKRKAEAELARQQAEAAAKTPVKPPPHPLAAGLPDNSSSGAVIYTPSGYTLGEFQISKEKTEGKGNDGNFLVILVIRCVNFPDTPIATSDWEIDGKKLSVPAGRIRASLSPGPHEATALFTPKLGTQPTEIKASITVQPTGECLVVPEKNGGR